MSWWPVCQYSEETVLSWSEETTCQPPLNIAPTHRLSHHPPKSCTAPARKMQIPWKREIHHFFSWQIQLQTRVRKWLRKKDFGAAALGIGFLCAAVNSRGRRRPRRQLSVKATVLCPSSSPSLPRNSVGWEVTFSKFCIKEIKGHLGFECTILHSCWKRLPWPAPAP